MYGECASSISQGVSNSTKALNEPWQFRQTLGVFGSVITNK